jgi:shikimate dehydrogenase
MKKFGLIGYPLGHSFSGKYFSEKFRLASITDCIYSNYEIGNISGLTDILKDPELRGLNITIPYKESVIPFLHEKDAVVREISACNCIRIDQGKLTGFNTDVKGFDESVSEKLTDTDKRALILGTGGSSKAVAWVLRKKGIAFLFVSRKKTGAANQISYDYLNPEILRTHPLIINTTPLGMYPATDDCPPIPYEYLSPSHYLFDLVYNPSKTRFLEKGEMAGARIKNGADMLAIQAEASWAVWNGGSAV